MEFFEIRIYTTTAGIDMLTGVLMDLGFDGFVVEDANDFEQFLTRTQPHWDFVDDSLMRLRNIESSIIVYAAKNTQGADKLAEIKSTLSVLREQDAEGLWGRLEVSLSTVREEDWANIWKQYFKPFPVGERLYIKPSWEDGTAPDNRVTLEIDPESSFGTGAHDTTQLCLTELEKAVFPGCEVLDMGCGSGILSIAALLLGAGHVDAVDIDENAVHIAERNLERNIADHALYSVHCGNVIKDETLAQRLAFPQRDVIAANIVADVIIAMRPLFELFLKPDGVLIVSGIIGERAQEVRRALDEASFMIADERRQNDWVCLRVRRKEMNR